MTKNTVGKMVGALSLFGGGAIIGGAVQEEIRTRQESKRRKEDAAEERLRKIEKRLWLAEQELETKEGVIEKLTKQVEAAKADKK